MRSALLLSCLLLLAPRLRLVERVAHHAFDAEAGVGADLGGDLVRGLDTDRTASAGVRALGAFPDDDEVDIRCARKRTRHTGEELRRPQVHMVIQREPGEGEEQTDIIMLTHKTRERDVDKAIAGIESLPAVRGRLIRLRLEELL